MRLQELFSPADILVAFAARDKWDALDRMLARLGRRGRVPAALLPEVHEAVLARERSMSTGMERGIAIPHAAVEGLDALVASLAITPRERGLNFESIDGSPTHLVVLLLIPRSQKLLHIRTLADVARVLGDDEVREALVAARTSEAAWEVLGRQPPE
ncbi:MAG: PTS sugar transporter subunit IIA [Planctomycetota bacterium]